MRTRLVVAALIGDGPAGALAETTQTEREAAAAILNEIDALQARIDPGATAKRLVAAGGAERDRVLARVEALRATQYRALSDHIGRNPQGRVQGTPGGGHPDPGAARSGLP